jgi:hypothetical protein
VRVARHTATNPRILWGNASRRRRRRLAEREDVRGDRSKGRPMLPIRAFCWPLSDYPLARARMLAGRRVARGDRARYCGRSPGGAGEHGEEGDDHSVLRPADGGPPFTRHARIGTAGPPPRLRRGMSSCLLTHRAGDGGPTGRAVLPAAPLRGSPSGRRQPVRLWFCAAPRSSLSEPFPGPSSGRKRSWR